MQFKVLNCENSIRCSPCRAYLYRLVDSKLVKIHDHKEGYIKNSYCYVVLIMSKTWHLDCKRTSLSCSNCIGDIKDFSDGVEERRIISGNRRLQCVEKSQHLLRIVNRSPDVDDYFFCLSDENGVRCHTVIYALWNETFLTICSFSINLTISNTYRRSDTEILGGRSH